MGSIASHPKVPSAASTVYVPVYSPAPATTTATTSTTTGATTSSASDTAGGGTGAGSTSTAASKTSSLLDRSRGVFSTVLTGFRGVLSDSKTPQRKNLLGE